MPCERYYTMLISVHSNISEAILVLLSISKLLFAISMQKSGAFLVPWIMWGIAHWIMDLSHTVYTQSFSSRMSAKLDALWFSWSLYGPCCIDLLVSSHSIFCSQFALILLMLDIYRNGVHIFTDGFHCYLLLVS
jgi:hypothetical protein